jgi:hypothetical protein
VQEVTLVQNVVISGDPCTKVIFCTKKPAPCERGVAWVGGKAGDALREAFLGTRK